jgi:hypothetical protein
MCFSTTIDILESRISKIEEEKNELFLLLKESYIREKNRADNAEAELTLYKQKIIDSENIFQQYIHNEILSRLNVIEEKLIQDEYKATHIYMDYDDKIKQIHNDLNFIEGKLNEN